MIFASIDIGSNAVRLLFANAYEMNGHPNIEKASLVRIPIRLGMDVFKNNYISKERLEYLIKTLKAFKLLIEVYKPVNYCAYATAAMREAKNSQKVLKKIYNKTGIDVQIIDGVEEANIIREMNNVILDKQNKIKMYIDVGGGSTDISLLEKNAIIDSKSFNIGTIRMLENKVVDNEWEKLGDFLKGLAKFKGQIYCIGSGGNINKLAKMFADPLKNTLTYDELNDIYNKLDVLSVDERMEKFGMRPDRADVIVPAAKIYREIMKHAKIDTIFVPRIGLVDGLIYRMYKDYKESGTEK